jgi:hypothetical protein
MTTFSTARRDSDQIGVTHTVRVSCNCKTCAINAKKVGAPFPLAAFIAEAAAEKMGITAANADKPKTAHGIVYMAHDPFIGRAQRMAIPVAE